MKRQLTSVLLFSALLVGGGSTLVSCTDHESDAAYNAQGSIADELNRQATDLQSQIDQLKTLLNGAGGLSSQVDALKQELATKEQELKDLIEQKNNATTQALEQKITTEINNVNTTIEGLRGDIANTNADIEALKIRIAAAEAAIDAAKDAAISAANAYTDAAKDAAISSSNAYTDAQVAAAAAAAQQALDQAIAGLQQQLENCHTACQAYTDEQINIVNGTISGLQGLVNTHTTQITELYTKYAELDAKLKNDSILIKQVQDDVTSLKTAVNNLSTKLDSKVDTADFNAVKAQVEANTAQCNANKAAIDSINAQIVNFVTKSELNNKAQELYDAISAAETRLSSEIASVKEELQAQLNKLYNAMVNMITGIELQATESPISGYENLSCLGLESHILGTYYGYAKDGEVKFLNGETVIGGNNELLIDSESGENAGVVYATINPSNKDFTGITLKVVDSQGNEAPFTATVVKSSRVLKYGVTRAGKSNLYAVKINLDKDKLNAAKTWTADDAASLKEAAKNVLDKLRKPGSTRLNLKQIGSSIEEVFNNRLTAYALQAEQNDTVDGKIEARFITSRMSLAATAIKPLSYNFLKDNEKVENLDLPRIPTLQSKFNFADYKFNWTPIEGLEDIKTSVTLKDMPDISTIKINGTVPTPDVETDVLIVGKDKVTGKVVGDDVIFDLSELGASAKVTIGDIDVSGLGITYDKKDQSYDVTIPMDDFNKIVDNINSQVGNMISKVDSLIDKVKGFTETIDGKYITRINNFIQRFENLLRKSNSLLQPALFYTTSTSAWNQLSRESRVPSYMKLEGGKASTIFIASSYNGEILCPAYKRCVSVTSKPEGATVSGENLGKVVGSETRKIGFEANKPGVYELTYEAVDYSGVKVSKKFYVKVVE